MSDQAATDAIEHLSPWGVDETLARLVEAIAKAGLRLFARIDHAENAREFGLSMPPATVLIYGHAKGGTPLMRAAPLAALDLPLRLLVHEQDDGRTGVVFHPAAAMLRRAGVPEELAGRLDAAQRLVVATLTP